MATSHDAQVEERGGRGRMWERKGREDEGNECEIGKRDHKNSRACGPFPCFFKINQNFLLTPFSLSFFSLFAQLAAGLALIGVRAKILWDGVQSGRWLTLLEDMHIPELPALADVDKLIEVRAGEGLPCG